MIFAYYDPCDREILPIYVLAPSQKQLFSKMAAQKLVGTITYESIDNLWIDWIALKFGRMVL